MKFPLRMRVRLRNWWRSRVAKVALALGIAMHLLGFLAFRVTAEPTAVRAAPLPFVAIISQSENDDLMQREQSLLLDSEALFLPTDLNAALPESATGLSEPDTALLQGAKPAVEAIAFALETNNQSVTQREPLSLQRLIESYADDSLVTFGRAPGALPMEPEDVVWVDVYDAYSGTLISTHTLPRQEDTNLGPEALEYLLYRTAQGSMGRLLPANSAAGQEAARALAAEIASASWQTTLPEGYYQLVVSP